MQMTGSKVRIVSDGTPAGTHVLDANGDQLKLGRSQVVRIEIEPIVANTLVTATVTIEDVLLDIDALVTIQP
jgi:hypothetical protein